MQTIKATPIAKVVKSVFIIIVGLITGLCLLISAYFTVFQWADRTLCYTRVGKAISVEPDYLSIRAYIEKSIKPGMTRAEVDSELKQIGPTIVEQRGSVDVILLKICLHPNNNIWLLTHYSTNGELVLLEIDID